MNNDLYKLFNGRRRHRRGFLPFYTDILAKIERNDLAEIGVSGAGSQLQWHLDVGFKNVIGVEVIDYPSMTIRKNGKKLEGEIAEKWKRKIEAGIASYESNGSPPEVQLFYGYSGYHEEDVDLVVSMSNSDKFDMIIDDGATGWPEMRLALPVWKKHLKDRGVFISETPDGNGTDQWRSMTMDEHLANFKEISEFGLRVYDMKEFQPEEARHVIDVSSTYLGFYVNDEDYFSDILDKYERYRVM